MNLLDIFSIEDEPIVDIDDVSMIISPIVNINDVSMIISLIVNMDDVNMIISLIVNIDYVSMIIPPIVNMDNVSMIIPPIVITIIVIVGLQSDTHKYASWWEESKSSLHSPPSFTAISSYSSTKVVGTI